MRTVEVNQTLNRNKFLEEAIFLAICGLNLCKENSRITGVVRLEMARDMIDKTIKHINESLGRQFCTIGINKPKDVTFNREQIYKLCFNRYLHKESIRNLTPNGKPLEDIRREANIFAVKHTNDWFLNQDKIKDW